MLCGGSIWRVGNCGGAELSVAADICTRDFQGRSVRPCIGSESWGGVSTETCFAPSQNMTVVCE